MADAPAADAPPTAPPSTLTTAPSKTKKRVGYWDKLKVKAKEDPAVYGFLGLTTAALTGGLVSLLKGDKKQSQLMMRARVFFQFCTITALIGAVYYRAAAGIEEPKPGTQVDKRVFMTNPKSFDEESVASVTAAAADAVPAAAPQPQLR